jgi:hypothetical protein
VEAPPFAERGRERESHSPERPSTREREKESEREIEREREEEGDHSREGSLYTKEATTSGGGRRGPAKTPLEEKEDTV